MSIRTERRVGKEDTRVARGKEENIWTKVYVSGGIMEIVRSEKPIKTKKPHTKTTHSKNCKPNSKKSTQLQYDTTMES